MTPSNRRISSALAVGCVSAESVRVTAIACAEAAGMSRVTLHRIEKGNPSVTIGAYINVATALGLRPHRPGPRRASDRTGDGHCRRPPHPAHTGLADWQRIAEAIHTEPWGSVARSVEMYASYGEEVAVSALLTRAIAAGWEAVGRSGLSAREFAHRCGMSASRLSTYRTGKVQLSAAMLVRFERLADRSGGALAAAAPEAPAYR